MNTARFLEYVWPFYNIMHERVKKENKIINSLRKLQNNLTRAPLVTIYKSFIRPKLRRHFI